MTVIISSGGFGKLSLLDWCLNVSGFQDDSLTMAGKQNISLLWLLLDSLLIRKQQL